jgi:hypothetical protein
MSGQRIGENVIWIGLDYVASGSSFRSIVLVFQRDVLVVYVQMPKYEDILSWQRRASERV